MTVKEALLRHQGLKESTLQGMLKKKKLKGKKVGRDWHIDVQDLNRVFLFNPTKH